MSPVAAAFVLLGSFVSLLSGIGMLRFRTPYARFHAAGKASPIAFLLVATGRVNTRATATTRNSARPAQPVSSDAPIATSRNAIGLALPAAWNRA